MIVYFRFGRQIRKIVPQIQVAQQVEQTEEQTPPPTRPPTPPPTRPPPTPHNKIFIRTPEFVMAQSYMQQMQVPEPILRKCRQVFSKYRVEDLRMASNSYMRLYQLLHAREKPSVLGVGQFENSKEEMRDESVVRLRGENEQDKEQDKEQREPKQHKYTKSTTNTTLNYDQMLVVCNLLRKAPASYAVSRRILGEINRRFPHFRPRTHLDFGAGLAPWGWGASETWKCEDTICVEPNDYMRKLSKFLNPSFTHHQTLSHTVTLPYDTFDLITIAYVLEEVASPSVRVTILQSLFHKLAPGGVMVLCAPGSPMGFRFVHDFRSMVLAYEDAKVLAPCPHALECPIAKQGAQWCHFDQSVATWPKSVFPKALHERNIVNEKFSYLVVQKQGENTTNTIAATTTTIPSETWSRIIFPPMKRGQHVIVDMCTKEGEMERLLYLYICRRVVAKSHGKEGGYYDIRRLRQGDLWRFPKWVPNKLKKMQSSGVKLW